MHKYLFQLKINTYNNRNPFYEIESLPNSDIKRVVLFGGQMQSLGRFKPIGRIRDIATTFIYLETIKPIEPENRYHNLEKLCQMICLATGQPANPEEVKIDQNTTFESVFEEYKHSNHFEDGVVYGGRVVEPNPIEKVVAYSHFLHKIDSGNNEKFENALQTFCWAYELEMLPNPHLKYTLCMTLYLSSINQLADNPKIKCRGDFMCTVCGDKIPNKEHSLSSHSKEMEKLIRNLITGDNVDLAVAQTKKLYSKIRSTYLHDGLLRGNERQGGFLADIESEENQKLVEDSMNLSTLNRMLIELFLQHQANQIDKV